MSNRAQRAAETADRSARFDGGLTLLGFDDVPALSATRASTVESMGRVEAPVSIVAHLLNVNSVSVAGVDGFGLPAKQFRPGDVIAQRHRFEILPDAPEGRCTIEVGFHRLDTLERYAVVGAPEMRVLPRPIVIGNR